MAREYNPTIDTNLQLRVQVALHHEIECSRGRDYILAIANQRGEVTLRGRVEGRQLSEEASRIAQSVPGVRLVFNQIVVARDCRSPVSV